MSELVILKRIFEDVEKERDVLEQHIKHALEEKNKQFALILLTIDNMFSSIMFAIDDYVRFYYKLEQMKEKGGRNAD